MSRKKWIREFYRQKAAMAAFLFLLLLILASLLIPAVSPYTYEMQDITARNQGSSFAHILGTDRLGRDLLVRIAEGIRISLAVGGISAAVCMIVGVIYGGTAGYRGGVTDLLMMRAADIIYSIPSLLYIILILLAAGPGAGTVTAGICIAGWIETARIVRSGVLREKEKDYCLAARFTGASGFRVLFVHLLPNLTGQILINAVYTMIQAIFMEAFLSFAGVGIAAPMASLGTLIQDARSQLMTEPMQMVWPAAALCLIVFSLHCISAGLSQALNPLGRRVR